MLVEKPEWDLWSDNTLDYLCGTKLVAAKLRKKLDKRLRYVVFLPKNRRSLPETMDTGFIGGAALRATAVEDLPGKLAADTLCAELCKHLGTSDSVHTHEERKKYCLEAFYELRYGQLDREIDSLIYELQHPNGRLQPYKVMSEANKSKVVNECLRRGIFAFFDPDLEEGIGWTLQILFKPRTNEMWVAEGYVNLPPSRPEQPIQNDCEEILRAHKIDILPHKFRDCRIGEADIVTANSVYEIKVVSSRVKFYETVGQVLLYKACLAKDRAFIVCELTGPASLALWIDSLRGYLQSLGINEVFLWPAEKGRFNTHARQAS